MGLFECQIYIWIKKIGSDCFLHPFVLFWADGYLEDLWESGLEDLVWINY